MQSAQRVRTVCGRVRGAHASLCAPYCVLFGHRQITDAWLLTLAARNGAKLATFDSGIAQLLATTAERERYLQLL